ncbi:hypothetical protein [Pantoea sp. A4]|uniref:hypothetical protein n=1 Tax=Pantoea sp. A4 TaxID=1225184 RepID=UPI000374D1DA|nr:hypothetical protein [Pantoea sp. A4]
MDKLCTVLHCEDGRITGIYYPDQFTCAVKFSEFLRKIENKAWYFSRYKRLLAVRISFGIACRINQITRLSQQIKALPFLRLVIDEDFPHIINGRDNQVLDQLCRYNRVWLGNLGSASQTGNRAMSERCFEGIIMDPQFTADNSGQPIFNSLMKELEKFASHLIVPGVCTGRYQQIRLQQFDMGAGKESWAELH